MDPDFDADPDPGSALKKMDPDPGHFFIFCLIFFAYFFLKLDEPFRNQETFIISLSSIVQM